MQMIEVDIVNFGVGDEAAIAVIVKANVLTTIKFQDKSHGLFPGDYLQVMLPGANVPPNKFEVVANDRIQIKSLGFIDKLRNYFKATT